MAVVETDSSSSSSSEEDPAEYAAEGAVVAGAGAIAGVSRAVAVVVGGTFRVGPGMVLFFGRAGGLRFMARHNDRRPR